jgi:hypothetical protein
MSEESISASDDDLHGDALSSVELSDISTEIRLIQSEIAFRAARTDSFDEQALRPLRWLNANVAWMGGLLFLVLVSVKVAIAAHMDLITMRSLAQAASIQSLAIQTIPLALPFVLLLIAYLTFVWAIESQSIWPIPVAVGIAIGILVSGAIMAPVVIFSVIVIVIAILVVGFVLTYQVDSDIRRNQERNKELELRNDRLVKSGREVSKLMKKCKKAYATLQTEIDEPELSDKRRQELRAKVEIIRGMANDLQKMAEALRRDSELLQGLSRSIRADKRLDLSDHSEQVLKGSKQKERGHKNRGWGDRSTTGKVGFLTLTSIAVVAFSAYLGIIIFNSSLWLPPQEFSMAHSYAQFSGYELASDEAHITILRETDRQIFIYKSDQIVSLGVCMEPNQTVGRSLYQIVLPARDQPHYPKCKG